MKLLTLSAAALAVATFLAPVELSPAHAASSMMSMAPKPHSWTVGDLTISGAYARATLPHAPVGGGYLTVTNKGSADDTLVSATSPAAGSVSLHSMSMDNGVMKMADLPDGVPIPAGKTVTFSPSGLHVMFEQLKGAFVKGKTVPLTLVFAKAGPVTIDLSIGSIAASAPPGEKPAAGSDDSMGGMKM